METTEQRWKAIEQERIAKRQVTLCNVPGCNRPFHAKGLCKMHYSRLYFTQNTVPMEFPDVTRHADSPWGQTPAQFSYFATWRIAQNDEARDRDNARAEADRDRYPWLFDTDSQQTAA